MLGPDAEGSQWPQSRKMVPWLHRNTRFKPGLLKLDPKSMGSKVQITCFCHVIDLGQENLIPIWVIVEVEHMFTN